MASDLDDWSVLEEESSSSFSLPPPHRSPSNQPEFWNRVEDATREIIEHVHPTLVSEDRRRDVIDYMQRLIRMTLGCEVHSFGSVPLKTYLPDGDIDLTAFGGLCHEEELAHKVFTVLEMEERNVGAQFMVKDVQLIRAEVKLVKCLVQNIVVDISFNQLGGICTLCFLEKIDHLIGKDHLFKRSIILIKAWCYYESRILGALHGLISTYALETLVLYIFHLFHSSLDGPLAVLYKFLDYFSKFDWDNYCISLNGPICLSSLPEIVVETPENGGQDLLLTSEFLKECLEMFSVPSRGFETNPHMFPSKHLNIVDPLKENNNLGRSVSKGNFYRIRSAFTYGARKLGQIILRSEEDISFELRKFFSNMLHRHGSGQRPDVLDVVPYVRYNRYSVVSPPSVVNYSQEGQIVYESESSSLSGATGNGRHDHDLLYARDNVLSTTEIDASGSPVGTSPSVSDERFAADAKDEMHLHYPGHCVSDTPNLLSDLTGDYDSQLNSLRYGRCWFDYVQNGPLSPVSPPVLSQFPNNNSWEVIQHALPFRRNAPGPVNVNGTVPRQVFFHMNHQMIPSANFGIEELPKTRGTGTYFPDANHYRDRPFSPRRNSHQARSPRYNGRSMTHWQSEMNFPNRNTRERQHLHRHPNQANGSSDMSQADSLESFSDTNGYAYLPYEKPPDFRSMDLLPSKLSSPPESSSQSDLSGEGHYNQSQHPASIPSTQEDRVTPTQSYHLADDHEFPPL